MLDLLIDRVQGRRLLLVLDNVEQLVAAAADLGVLLAACPDLTVLVTSRIVLRLRGEHEVPLAPLPVPREGPADAAAVGQSAAVRLLVARARQVRPDFTVTADNAAARLAHRSGTTTRRKSPSRTFERLTNATVPAKMKQPPYDRRNPRQKWFLSARRPTSSIQLAVH